MMGSLIEYWYYTKDDSFVDLTRQALLFQVGDDANYMPDNQTLTNGNDDQGFWGLSAMAAAEYNFPESEKEGDPSYLALAQAVFNTQAARWDTENCGGGLRWQIYDWNVGWDYKNSISQGTFFAIAARLALYTGNTTYADWAEKTWEWMVDLEYIDDHYYIYDGAHIPNNCTKIVPWQFTYNPAVFIVGAAALYNFTESDLWKARLDGLLDGADIFFRGENNDTMIEVACERLGRCNADQKSFKAYLSRWLAATVQWAPHTFPRIMPKLRASAVAATSQCVGGDNGRMCGLEWSSGKYDGTQDVGQQMAALEITLSCMIQDRDPILTENTGGTSESDPGAGGESIGSPPGSHLKPITSRDHVGAAVLTAILASSMVAAAVWLIVDETSDKPQPPLQQLQDSQTSDDAGTALASAPGAAALHKRSMRDVGQKTIIQTHAASSLESNCVDEDTRSATSPVRVSRVEKRASGHSRRASNMPRGWPHDAALRSSVVGKTSSDWPFPRSTRVSNPQCDSQSPESMSAKKDTADSSV